jgi:hypothetical protein
MGVVMRNVTQQVMTRPLPRRQGWPCAVRAFLRPNVEYLVSRFCGPCDLSFSKVGPRESDTTCPRVVTSWTGAYPHPLDGIMLSCNIFFSRCGSELRSWGGPGAMHVGTLGRRLLALVSLAAACCDRRSQPSGICGTVNTKVCNFFAWMCTGPTGRRSREQMGYFPFRAGHRRDAAGIAADTWRL